MIPSPDKALKALDARGQSEPSERGTTRKETMSLIEHLEELRYRLLFWLGGFAGLSILSFFYSGPLLRWMIKPVGRLVFLAPPKPLWCGLKSPYGRDFFLPCRFFFMRLGGLW